MDSNETAVIVAVRFNLSWGTNHDIALSLSTLEEDKYVGKTNCNLEEYLKTKQYPDWFFSLSLSLSLTAMLLLQQFNLKVFKGPKVLKGTKEIQN